VQSFEFLLKSTQEEINSLLNIEISTLKQETCSRLYQAMEYSLLTPGKRFRPFLVLASCRLFDVPQSYALRVALAVEFVHCYSLVHDDLPSMDDSPLRRGKATTHIQFDEATALLAGNSLLTQAFAIITNPLTHPDAAVRCQLTEQLAKAAGSQGMMSGQMLDLLGENKILTLDETIHLQNLKTGALIAFSCKAGALLSQQPPVIQEKLHNYAHALGLAYQIKDDLFDYMKTATEIGKPVGHDQKAKKSTFISLLGIEKAQMKIENLIQTSSESLKTFDERANLLRQAAEYVLNRSN
jgi:farnesyl diphosphate synthase